MQAYRALCQNCDFASPKTVGGVPALILDAPSDDPDADPTDPRLIRLDDERGREAIARHGYSFISCILSGRYLRVQEVFCTDCGRLYQIRSLAPAFAQCWVRLWVILTIPFAILFYAISPGTWTGIFNGLFFGLIAGGATIAVIDPVICALLRVRYPTRAREFSVPAVCPECGSKSKFNPATLAFVRESERSPKKMPCPNCKMITMTIDVAETTNAA